MRERQQLTTKSWSFHLSSFCFSSRLDKPISCRSHQHLKCIPRNMIQQSSITIASILKPSAQSQIPVTHVLLKSQITNQLHRHLWKQTWCAQLAIMINFGPRRHKSWSSQQTSILATQPNQWMNLFKCSNLRMTLTKWKTKSHAIYSSMKFQHRNICKSPKIHKLLLLNNCWDSSLKTCKTPRSLRLSSQPQFRTPEPRSTIH